MKASYYIEKLSGKKKQLAEFYIKIFGDQDVYFLRIPARINLLGTHIEHRGGYVNYLTIDRELYCIFSKREDAKVVAHNLDKKYQPVEFDINAEGMREKVDWVDFIRKAKIIPGEWGNYIKASVLYIKNMFIDRNLYGMNMCFYGEIPVGAGLSSSSAVVVASMMAFCKINGIEIEKEKLVEMCGEAEWYVGTRGGSGDHAAMIFGRKNQIAHLRFFPFQIEYLPFPEDYKVICCNSLIQAKKSKEAKNEFNERIACYEIGFSFIKKNFPQYNFQYLRDVNPENVGSDEEIFKMLLSIPERIDRKGIKEIFKDENFDPIFETHREPEDGYAIRDVLLYGISECERSRICGKFLKKKDMESFGKLMLISHDGDRVGEYKNEKKVKWEYKVDNNYLQMLIKNKAKVYEQPGAYRCSTPELDYIVDVSKRLKGVKGAKLTGAGLGGCVLILVEEKEAENVIEIINKEYYRKKGLPEVSFICNSCDGAQFI